MRRAGLAIRPDSRLKRAGDTTSVRNVPYRLAVEMDLWDMHTALVGAYTARDMGAYKSVKAKKTLDIVW